MLTEDQIQFLNGACPNRWIEEDNIINVKGSVDMSHMNLTKIPVQFDKVTGYFDCSNNKLTTLKGCPYIVNLNFICDKNKLTALEDGPKEVYNEYSCEYNQLSNLIGAAKICNSDFWCRNNKLTSLEGCPQLIKGYLFCNNNPNLKYLWGISRLEGYISYDTFNENELNRWIIGCMQKNIIFPYYTLVENINWIKHEQKYSCLLGAPKEIRQYFAPRILHLVDSGVYNESKILLNWNQFIRESNSNYTLLTTLKSIIDNRFSYLKGKCINKNELLLLARKNYPQIETYFNDIKEISYTYDHKWSDLIKGINVGLISPNRNTFNINQWKLTLNNTDLWYNNTYVINIAKYFENQIKLFEIINTIENSIDLQFIKNIYIQSKNIEILIDAYIQLKSKIHG